MNLFLAEIPVWNGSAETTLKYASGLGYTNGSDWYAPRIENPATYSVSLNAGGLASGSYGELTLVNVDGALDALADYAVDGRFLTLKYGDESAAYNTFTTVLVAMMESISLERDRVSIRLRDPARQLDKPITTRTYAGTGGLAGDATLKDTPKPIVVGEAVMIKPVLIDAARLIYQVHDGYVAAIVQVLNKAGQPITSGGDFASEATLLDNGTNLLPTGWGDFESGDNDPYVTPTAEVIKVTSPSGNSSYVRNWGSVATFSIVLSTNATTYNITGLTAGQKYRVTAKVMAYPNVGFRFQIWTASGVYYGPAFTAQYGMTEFSAVIDLAGDANTSLAVGIGTQLNTYDVMIFDKFSIIVDPVVTAGTFKAWRDVNGSYIRLGSDPAGDIAVSVAEYSNGSAIGLLPGHALYRLATEYGHIITQPLTTSGTAQSVAADRTTITLAAGASATDDAYNTQYIKVIDGDAVQMRSIVDYVGSTKVATLDAALQTLTDTPPDYEIAPGVIWKDGNNYAAELQAVSDAYRNLAADQTGTAQGGGTGNNQIQLATSASSTDDIYNGKTVIILSGTGSGQERTISDYVGSTRTATVSSNWTTNPNNTSVYEINEAAAVRLCNAGVGIFSGDAANLKSLMDMVAESVHAWYAFDATNKLRMGLFRDPDDETAVATLTEDNILTLDRVTDSNPESLPNWRITVNSGKRWNPLNANDAIPASLINLTKGWANTSKQTDSAIKPVHKLSTERSFDSLMIDADGQRGDLLATDLLTLYKARHDTVNATIADPGLEFLTIDIGKVVTVTLNRFGYNSGRKLRVISLRRDFQRGLIDLTLWG